MVTIGAVARNGSAIVAPLSTDMAATSTPRSIATMILPAGGRAWESRRARRRRSAASSSVASRSFSSPRWRRRHASRAFSRIARSRSAARAPEREE